MIYIYKKLDGWRSGKPTGHLCRRHDPSRGVSNHLWNIETASCLQYTKCIVSFGFWHFHFHILLASSVLRIALSHIEIGA